MAHGGDTPSSPPPLSQGYFAAALVLLAAVRQARSTPGESEAGLFAGVWGSGHALPGHGGDGHALLGCDSMDPTRIWYVSSSLSSLRYGRIRPSPSLL